MLKKAFLGKGFYQTISGLLAILVLFDSIYLSHQSETYGPAILGAIIAGGMTIVAGWLAFQATWSANEISRNIEARTLLLENIKATNMIRDELANIGITLLSIYGEQIPQVQKSIEEILCEKNPSEFHVRAAAQCCKKYLPDNIDFGGKLADALALLPEQAEKELRAISALMGGERFGFDLAIESCDLDEPLDNDQQINIIRILQKIFVEPDGDYTPFEQMQQQLGITASYFYDLKFHYRSKLADIVDHFI
jgi:hypothetical protein